MKISGSRCPFLALVVLFLLSGCGSGPHLDCWTVDSLEKVFPDDDSGAHEAAGDALLIARNGHASVQIALRSKDGVAALGVAVAAPEFAGALLPVEIRRVGYVPVGSNPTNTPPDEVIRPAPSLFPDPLLEDFPFNLPARETHAVWLTISCPADARPGEYRGTVRFAQNGRQLAKKNFTMRVMPAAVPARQTLKVTNWFNLDRDMLRRHYPSLDRDPENYWRLLENIGRVLAAHRQNVLITPITSLTDMVPRAGSIEYRFDRLDRWVATFERAGVLGTIEGGHLLGRASGYDTELVVPTPVVEQGKVVWKNLPPEDARGERFLNSYLSALYKHLQEKNWTGRYLQHIHDEPHGAESASYQRYGRIIRRNLPGIPTIDAISLDEDVRYFDVTDIWVMILGSFDHKMDVLGRHIARGGQAWFYTCVYPQGRYLNRFIDQPLVKTRLLHWFNYRHNLAGFLHWGGNFWGPSPFENVQRVINDNHTLLPAGDNAVVYPAPAADTVLSSVRLEAMREGIEDYELLHALGERDAARAQALAVKAIPHINDYMRDPAEFRKLERQLLEAF
jgi:hypothetical protein